jgi:hypothetical protein
MRSEANFGEGLFCELRAEEVLGNSRILKA